MDSLVAMPRGDERRLDGPPPMPPAGQRNALMAMGSDSGGDGAGFSNPAVRAMAAMGAAKSSLLEVAALLPGMSAGIRQIIDALETSAPEQIAALIDGNPLGPAGPMGG